MQYFGFDRPSFGVKTFGFGESNAKLSADFTTGTYKADGASKTFADLFTFTRAGKAWLVKEIGLQEYEADVPRFDDGLMIEQSATNHLATLDLTPDPVRCELATATSLYGLALAGRALIDITATILVSSGSLNAPDINELTLTINTNKTSRYVVLSSDSTRFIIDTIANTVRGAITGFTANRQGDWLLVKIQIPPLLVGRLRLSWGKQVSGTSPVVEVGDTSEFALVGVYESAQVTLIPTTETPVTRPADFLINKVTGTTVTGDWDGTLTLSIVAGQLVHSGYGRIRSLEIN